MLPPLRQYQVDTINWLTEHPRAMLGHDPGLGKTVALIKAVERLKLGPVLVVAALRRALRTWPREIALWGATQPASVVMWHTPAQRRTKLTDITDGYVLTTANMLPHVLEQRRRWPAIIVDEAHVLAGRRTQMFHWLTKFHSDIFWWVSGSLAPNGKPDELWTGLHCIDPHRFSSYWRWVDETCVTDHNGYGVEIIGVNQPARVRKLLKPYVLRYTKVQLADQLPPKQRRARRVELTKEQERLYDQMANSMIADIGNDEHAFVLAGTNLAKVTRLRQILVTPALIGGHNDSGALEELREFANEYRKPLVVFTPFAKAIPHIEEYLKRVYRQIELVHGGLSDASFSAAIDRFERSGEPRRALLSTIRSAASWETPSASTAVFIGFDWTAEYNIQAEDRLHRLTSQEPIDIWYLQHEGTIDEHNISIVDRKAHWAQLFLNPKELLHPTVDLERGA